MWRAIALAGLMVLGPSSIARAHASPAATPTHAQPANTQTRRPDPTRPPDIAQIYAAFRSIEPRVRAWNTEPFETPVRFPGVQIQLRLDGELVGIATDDTGDRTTLAAALHRAMARVERRLALPRDALYDESIRAHAQRLTITLSAAGPLVPFAPEALADASLLISPGVEGVAARLGDRTATMYPARMIETGTLPAGALRVLVAQASGDPALGLVEPASLQADHGITLYRFAVRTVAQHAPGKAAIMLVRGGQLIDRSAISTRVLRDRTDRLARYILDQTTRRVVGLDLLGPDDPADLKSKQTAASAIEQALAAIALARYAALPGDTRPMANASGHITRPVRPRHEAEARTVSAALVLGLADRARQDATIASDPAAAALVCAAITRIQREHPRAFAAHAPLVEALDRRAFATLELVLDQPSSVPSGVLPPVAYALALRADSMSPEQRHRVEVLVRAIYHATPQGMLVSHMPWLGWAELELARGADRVPAAGALEQMRQLVFAHQLSQADAGADAPDLVGGIVFTASRTPLPTWQAARPLAFLATMLGDDRLTPDARVAHQLASLVSAHRFLAQLALDAYEAAASPGGRRALGGITAAPWDRRLFPEASALTLITLCETLGSIDAIQTRRRAPTAAPDP